MSSDGVHVMRPRPVPGAMRTARLLALTGLCLGFGLAAVCGAPFTSSLSR